MDDIALIEADLRDVEAVSKAVAGVDAVSHQGALGSVPRSVDDPLTSHDVNVNGTLNVLEAMRRHGVNRIVFAASSSAYGHQVESPKVETMSVSPASPYAASKVSAESYIRSYAQVYGMRPKGRLIHSPGWKRPVVGRWSPGKKGRTAEKSPERAIQNKITFNLPPFTFHLLSPLNSLIIPPLFTHAGNVWKFL